jgi:hypothetical protein
MDLSDILTLVGVGITLVGLAYALGVKGSQWDAAREDITLIRHILMERALQLALEKGTIIEKSPYEVAPALSTDEDSRNAGRMLLAGFKRRTLPATDHALAVDVFRVMGTEFCGGRSKVKGMCLDEYLIACAIHIRSKRSPR